MSASGLKPASLRCPTCGASQPWSDTCRRCRSDLSLVHRVLQDAQHLRECCLDQLARQQHDAAAGTALRCCRLDPSPDNRRLLAVAQLLRGGFTAAVEIAAAEGDRVA